MCIILCTFDSKCEGADLTYKTVCFVLLFFFCKAYFIFVGKQLYV